MINLNMIICAELTKGPTRLTTTIGSKANTPERSKFQANAPIDSNNAIGKLDYSNIKNVFARTDANIAVRIYNSQLEMR